MVKNRIFGGPYNFLHQHGSLIKSMCTSCKSSKNASVEVEESGVKCRVILCQMSNYLSWISAYDNCIWIFRIIRFALEKYFLSILHLHAIMIPTNNSEFLPQEVWYSWNLVPSKVWKGRFEALSFTFKRPSVRWKYQANSTRLRQEEWHDGLNEKARLHSNTSRRCIVWEQS